jgi:hypothetical protein
MTQSAGDLENTFAQAWKLLVRNPVIVVPCIAIALLSGALEFAFAAVILGSFAISGNGSPDAVAAADTISAVAVFIVSLALALVQMAFVTGMAGAAWQHGRAGLRDGWNALSNRWLAAIGAGALLLIVGLCAAALAPVTFLVTLLAYAVFFIYTMAAVVIGKRAPVDGLVESARTALANVLPTLAVVALIAAIAALGGWLGSLAGRISDLAGWLIAGLLQQVIVAYASLVVAGEYLKLASRPAQPGSTG